MSDLSLVFEPPGSEPYVVNGMGGSSGGVVRVGREHPVPADEEEFVGGLREDVSGGGTMMEEDHFLGGKKGHGLGGKSR